VETTLKKSTILSGLKAGAAPLALSLFAVASPAFAQAAAEEAASDIVVTGSRIARPNLEAASPVTVVSAEAIKEFGATKIEDLTNALPQVFAGQNSGVSNGADGTATIDLRGLGASRTVVLVDGRRLMPGSIGGGAGADLNFIPAALVSGVEILTGGASATYGADAVAGVVNFKMNRDFRGVRVDAQYGFYQHSNSSDLRDTVNGSGRVTAPEGNVTTGEAYDATLALGAGFDDDRGNIVAYAGYRRESAITQDKYDYSICTLNENANGDGFSCGGSGTPARARFGGLLDPTKVREQAVDADDNLVFDDDGNPVLKSAKSLSAQSLLDDNSLRTYASSTDAYNFGPANYYRRPSDRYTAGAFAEYEISDSFKPYMDIMFMDYSTKAQIAPSGAFYGVRTVNCDNPLLLANPTLAALVCQTAGENLGDGTVSTVGEDVDSTILIGKRNIEGGNRYNDIGFNQFRIVTGMKGNITDAWSYDIYAQMGQIKVANTYRNDVSNARIDRALQVVDVNGTPTCKSVVDGSDPSCVPYNVFNAGGISSAAAAYIGIPLVLTGTTKEKVFAGQITGDLGSIGLQSPLSGESVKVAFGAEMRTESLETSPDLAYIN
jgi:outer membrane receptor protein involved in Fe transport